MTAIEMTGTVDEYSQLKLDDEVDEASWLQGVSLNPVFAFLADPEEDIYSTTDGKPFSLRALFSLDE